MKREERVLENFFRCLKAHDSGGLLRCYDPEVEHTDWVFVQLRGRRAAAKWALLFERVPALDVHVHVLHVSGNQGLAAWELRYPGTPPIHHRIATRFRLKNGRIVRHDDRLESDGCRTIGPPEMLAEHFRGPQPQLAVLGHRSLQLHVDGYDDEPTAPLPCIVLDAAGATSRAHP